MNPLIGELKNVFTSGKVVGKKVEPDSYRKQLVNRGDPQYMMGCHDLMEFDRCPHRWIAGYESEETKQTEWGQIVDCLALTPDRWKSDFAVAPETYPDSKTGEAKPWNWNANFCKDWRTEQNGKRVVKSETFQQAENAVKILYGKPETREILECSDRQVMCVAEYCQPETEVVVPVKILIDLLPDLGTPVWQSTLGDLKTANSAGAGWRRKVYEMNYHVQAAFYIDVYRSATGEDRAEFVHVIQESFPPWEPARKVLSAEFIELGRMQYQAALLRYAQCLKTGQWPGYGGEIVEPEPWMLQ